MNVTYCTFSLKVLIRETKSNEPSDANDKEMLNPAEGILLRPHTHDSTFHLKSSHLDVVAPVVSTGETFKDVNRRHQSNNTLFIRHGASVTVRVRQK